MRAESPCPVSLVLVAHGAHMEKRVRGLRFGVCESRCRD